MEGPGLISVRTQVALDTLVDSIADAVAGRAEQLPAPAEAALASIGDERRRALGRAGYLSRAVEVERFERARAPMPWLSEQMGLQQSGGASWRGGGRARRRARGGGAERSPRAGRRAGGQLEGPRPGGHVRHYLAIRAADDGRDGGPSPDAKRAWLAGFLIHCIQEAVPPPSSSESP